MQFDVRFVVRVAMLICRSSNDCGQSQPGVAGGHAGGCCPAGAQHSLCGPCPGGRRRLCSQASHGSYRYCNLTACMINFVDSSIFHPPPPLPHPLSSPALPSTPSTRPPMAATGTATCCMHDALCRLFYSLPPFPHPLFLSPSFQLKHSASHGSYRYCKYAACMMHSVDSSILSNSFPKSHTSKLLAFRRLSNSTTYTDCDVQEPGSRSSQLQAC